MYQAADLNTSNGYAIGADFGSTGGLVVGDDVRLSGIKVGRIVSQSLDPVTYTARINMQIDGAIKLPEDSSARITAASLLGGNFLEILPGNSDEVLEAGAVIYDTRDPVSLSDLLGKFVFQNNDDGTR